MGMSIPEYPQTFSLAWEAGGDGHWGEITGTEQNLVIRVVPPGRDGRGVVAREQDTPLQWSKLSAEGLEQRRFANAIGTDDR